MTWGIGSVTYYTLELAARQLIFVKNSKILLKMDKKF